MIEDGGKDPAVVKKVVDKLEDGDSLPPVGVQVQSGAIWCNLPQFGATTVQRNGAWKPRMDQPSSDFGAAGTNRHEFLTTDFTDFMDGK